jgi:hypothetical protein
MQLLVPASGHEPAPQVPGQNRTLQQSPLPTQAPPVAMQLLSPPLPPLEELLVGWQDPPLQVPLQQSALDWQRPLPQAQRPPVQTALVQKLSFASQAPPAAMPTQSPLVQAPPQHGTELSQGRPLL